MAEEARRRESTEGRLKQSMDASLSEESSTKEPAVPASDASKRSIPYEPQEQHKERQRDSDKGYTVMFDMEI